MINNIIKYIIPADIRDKLKMSVDLLSQKYSIKYEN